MNYNNYRPNMNSCSSNRPQKKEPSQCKDSCNPGVPYRPIGEPSDKCCKASISAALQAIKQAVYSVNIPGFGVNIIITTITGYSYTILVSASTAYPLVIGKDTLTYGTLMLNLDDIAKIQIEASAVANTTFTTNLLNLLKGITNCPTTGNCGCGHYLAFTSDDDDDYDVSLTRGYCGHCGRPTNQCSCGTCRPNHCNPCPSTVSNLGFQDYINKNPNNIASINYLGSYEQIEDIQVIDTIADTPVIQTATLSTTTTSVISSISIASGAGNQVVEDVSYTNQTVVSNVTATTESMAELNNLFVKPTTTFITGYTPLTTTALTGLGTPSTTVVSTGYPSPTIETVVGGNIGVGTANINAFSTYLVTLPAGTAGGILSVTIGGASYNVRLIDAAGGVLSNTVSVIPYTIATINNSVTVASITGTPVATTVVKSLGTQSTATVLTNVGTIASTNVLTSLGAPSTDTGLTDLNIAPGVTLSVVTGISLDTVSVNSITSVDYATIVDATDITSTQSTVLASAQLYTTPINVLVGVGLDTISVLSPMPEDITGTVALVGSGLVVIQELNGDITIYSVCEIDSVSTNY